MTTITTTMTGGGTSPMPKANGTGIGSGHGGNSNLPVIRPGDPHPLLKLAMETGMEPDAKFFRMGKVSIFVGRSEVDGWHMSIAHPERYPTWDEVAKARYELIPDGATMAMLLPPRSEYINIHNFCFQLWEIPAKQGDSHEQTRS